MTEGPPLLSWKPLIHGLVWTLGLLGFLVPMVLARNSPHADVLRGMALAWFVLFGMINAALVLRPAGKARRDL